MEAEMCTNVLRFHAKCHKYGDKEHTDVSVAEYYHMDTPWSTHHRVMLRWGRTVICCVLFGKITALFSCVKAHYEQCSNKIK